MHQIIKIEQYRKGDIIFKEGSYGQVVYLINKGKVEIAKILDGKKVVIETIGPGDLFGEMSFIDSEPRSASAIAIENTEVGVMDNVALDLEVNKLCEDARDIVKTIVERLRKTTRQTITLSLELHKLRKEKSQ